MKITSRRIEAGIYVAHGFSLYEETRFDALSIIDIKF